MMRPLTTYQYKILCYIRECNQANRAITAMGLSRHFGNAPTSMLATVKILQAKGYVTYKRNLPIMVNRMPYSEGIAA